MSREQWYEEERLLRSGEAQRVYVCVVCNRPMEKMTWRDTRRGILYEFTGWKCRTEGCSNAKEETCSLIGPPDSE